LKIASAIALVDDRRRVAKSDQEQVEQKSPGAAVAIQKGMYLLEAHMQIGKASSSSTCFNTRVLPSMAVE
jgi:hypothetical protein